MAGLGKKTFTAGEVLTAADVNGYLMEQSVMVFGGTAARSSAVPSPSEGMISYLTDSDVTETFNGTAWTSVLNPPINAQAGTAYTFTRVDASRTVTASNGSASTYTIPPQADVAWPDGATLTLRNLGAGVVTIAGGSGVTVTNTAQTVAQYGSVKIIRTGSNAWTVLPDSGGATAFDYIGTYTLSSTATNITSIFSSTYTNYKLIFNAPTLSSVSYRFLIQMLSGTTPDTSNNYSWQRLYAQVTTVGTTNTTSTSGSIGYTLSTDNQFKIVEISRPFLAKPTQWQAYSNENGANLDITYGLHNVSTSYNGLRIIAEAGNMTGTVDVYGYKG